MEVASRLNGIGEYYFSQKLREIDAMNRQGADVINLGIGSPDLPPHPDVISTLANESAKPSNHAYQSYKGSPVLRKAISEWYKRSYDVVLDPEKQVLPLIGSKEGIMHICMTYFSKGDVVLIPDPGYPTYASAVKISGALPVEYPLDPANNWVPDINVIEQKISAMKDTVKAIFVNYPHMPTGVKADSQFLQRLVDLARKHGILIIHDNPYSFILNDKPQSMLGLDGANDHVIELNSLSKSHNMAGWRVGMLCGNEKVINDVLRFKSNMDSGMFLPIQLAAAKALQLGSEWHESVNDIYRKRREHVYAMLDQLQCTYSKDQAGLFIWASVPAKYANGIELSDEILKNSRVFITPGSIFGRMGEKYIRVSLCSKEERIKEALVRITK